MTKKFGAVLLLLLISSISIGDQPILECTSEGRTVTCVDGDQVALKGRKNFWGTRLKLRVNETWAGLLAGQSPGPEDPPNNAPTWTGTPAPNWTENVGGTYDLEPFTSDLDNDTLTFSLNASSAALPTGVSLSSAGLLTATTAVSQGTTTGILVDIDDGTNAAVTSPSFDITILASGASGKKWQPGLYYRVQGQAAQSNQTTWLNTQLSAISGKTTELDGTVAEMKGTYVAIAWGVGNPTGSTYDDSQIDALLARAETEDKYLLLMVTNKSFLGSGVSYGYEAPADLSDIIVATQTGAWARLDVTANMDRFIAYLKYLATKYDSHPRLEAILTVEPTPSFGQVGAPAGYTTANLRDEWKRMYEEVCPDFVKTTMAPGVNHLGGSGAADYTDDLLIHARTHCAAFSNPDTRDVDAWHWYEGTDYELTDYRGQMARISTISQSSWSKTSRTTPEIIDFYQLGQVTHAAWVSQTVSQSQTGNTYSWDDPSVTLGTKEALKADPSVQTACPTLYTGCD